MLREMLLGARRFEEFMERLPINRAALTSRLSMLVEAGMIERDPPKAKRAIYRLTEAGRDLVPVFQAIGSWGAQHLFTPDEERPRFS